MPEDEIEKMMKEEPLITGVSVGAELQNSTGNYFGIGLSNRHGLTAELPFDVMMLVLGAELTKRKLDLETVTTLIADEHAKTNGFSESEIDAIAKSRREFLFRSLDRLNFRNWEVYLGSEIAREPQHQQILSCAFPGNRYERMQLADMEFFRSRRKSIKIGWKHNGMEFDERHFDSMYESSFGKGTTFIYTQPGRALDGTPLPPYLHVPNKPRLVLSETEDIRQKVEQMPKRVRSHFNRMADLFEKLVYGSASSANNNNPENLEKRLKNIYGVVFG
ncbi:MAG: hypothetical protein HY515_03965 [Candidatus Aenigmarchaeota archaeon]|nr:hypothetical protein [Candidatus Aenigmarchaeota archaeon]